MHIHEYAFTLTLHKSQLVVAFCIKVKKMIIFFYKYCKLKWYLIDIFIKSKIYALLPLNDDAPVFIWPSLRLCALSTGISCISVDTLRDIAYTSKKGKIYIC